MATAAPTRTGLSLPPARAGDGGESDGAEADRSASEAGDEVASRPRLFVPCIACVRSRVDSRFISGHISAMLGRASASRASQLVLAIAACGGDERASRRQRRARKASTSSAATSPTGSRSTRAQLRRKQRLACAGLGGRAGGHRRARARRRRSRRARWHVHALGRLRDPSDSTGLPRGVPPGPAVPGALSLRQGQNDGSDIPGYDGPCPPEGEHGYVFTLYALDEETGLEGGATVDDCGRDRRPRPRRGTLTALRSLLEHLGDPRRRLRGAVGLDRR